MNTSRRYRGAAINSSQRLKPWVRTALPRFETSSTNRTSRLSVCVARRALRLLSHVWQPGRLVATGLASALVAGVVVWTLQRPAPLPPPPVSRYVVTPPATAPLANLGGVDLEISPDGTRLAYFGRDTASDRLALYLRDLDELDARVVSGNRGHAHRQCARTPVLLCRRRVDRILVARPRDHARGGRRRSAAQDGR